MRDAGFSSEGRRGALTRNVSSTSDRCYSLTIVKAECVVEPANFIQAFLDTFAKIAPSKHPKPMSLEIPALRLAGRAAEKVEARHLDGAAKR